jgi:hypothetical protein
MTMRLLRFFAIVSVFAVLWVPGASAQSPVQRDVLALYSTLEEGDPANTRIHRMIEMPLNHLGYRLSFHDVDDGLPAKEVLSNYAAIVTWFEHAALPAGYAAWGRDFMTEGGRFVIFGEPGGGADDETDITILLAALGLRATGADVNVTYDLMPKVGNPSMIGFEAPLDIAIPPFPVYKATGNDVRIHFGFDGKNIPGGETAILLATNPNGGFAASGFITRDTYRVVRSKWLIDPFMFLSAALGTGMDPVPDTTTLAGRRIYFSHIDGDGWNNRSEIESYRAQSALSAEVILHEAISKYPDLPVTVGLIGADVDPELGGLEEAARIARALFALPQVEVASHTYTHPYRWQFFEDYSRADEVAELEQRKRTGDPTGLLDRIWLRINGADSDTTYVHIGDTENDDDDPPRAFHQKPFDLALETAGALKIAEDLAPAGKKAALYLWSGDTNPFEEAVASVRRAGAFNMNGGDSRFDSQFPSMIYVPPLSRSIGAERQIYAVNSNENTYTNLWKGPFYGYRLLEQTFNRTGYPRRLKPVNVYYHMYTGEKAASLTALVHHLDWARQAALIPVTASHYAHIANDFFGASITRIAPSRWRVANRGAVQTFRFDNAGRFAVDLDKSRGVLGARRSGDALYVALEPIEKEPEIAIAELSGQSVQPVISRYDRPYLIESRQMAEAVKFSDCHVSAQVNGFGKVEMAWGSMAPGEYRLTLKRPGEAAALWTHKAVVGKDGILKFTADRNPAMPALLSVECLDKENRTN